ncbi:MAG: hypothetical protein KDK66_06075, partial [Deltaproteobacteria bacterium]|nr:hypothetical protein [Deltaproteobacteria bacterium]
IPFDPAAFRDLVKDQGKSLSGLEPITGVSKQAINGWLSSAKIPPRQLYKIAENLHWKSKQVDRVLKKSGFHEICFRTHRNVETDDGIKQLAKRIAADFFTLDALGGDYSKDSFIFRVGKDANALAVAEGILRQLDLKRGQFQLEELVFALARVNVSVIFLDFGHHFSLEEKPAKHVRAFCAKQGPKFMIAIDSRMKGSQMEGEDITWVIFHELAHIACGDMDEGSSDFWEDSGTKEKFRNEIASEVLTPTDLLLSHQTNLTKFLDCPLRLLPSRIEHMASELGASFVGMVLALKKIGLLTTQKERYLWGVQHNRDVTRPQIKDFIFPRSAKNRQDLIESWGKILNNSTLLPFLKLYFLVRQGLIEQKLSLARAAELMGIETGEMEELEKHWVNEVSNEAFD